MTLPAKSLTLKDIPPSYSSLWVALREVSGKCKYELVYAGLVVLAKAYVKDPQGFKELVKYTDLDEATVQRLTVDVFKTHMTEISDAPMGEGSKGHDSGGAA